MSFKRRPRRRATWAGRRGGADVHSNHWMNLPSGHPPAVVGVGVGVRAIIARDRMVVIEHELPHHFDLATNVLPEEGVGPRRFVLIPVLGAGVWFFRRLRYASYCGFAEWLQPVG